VRLAQGLEIANLKDLTEIGVEARGLGLHRRGLAYSGAGQDSG